MLPITVLVEDDAVVMVADGDGEVGVGISDDAPPSSRNKSAKFSLDVRSSIASVAVIPLVAWADRNAVDTVMTFVASFKLKPSDSIV